jgi:hypothetical protein
MATMGVLLVVPLLLLTVPLMAAADAFCDNLKSVAATLPKNTSSSPQNFATATFGQAPDTVYALALCRGDVLDNYICAGCLTSTFDMALNQTPSPQQQCYKIATVYYNDCILFYSLNNILAAPPNTTGIGGDGTPVFERWNIKNSSGLIEGAYIQDLLAKTVEEAAASILPRLFGTAVLDPTAKYRYRYPKVYSLAQCTPDLSARSCHACLSNLLSMVNFTMSMRIGGQMGAIRCYLRYELSQFYIGEPMLRLGLPSAAALATTKPKSESSPLLFVVSTYTD